MFSLSSYVIYFAITSDTLVNKVLPLIVHNSSNYKIIQKVISEGQKDQTKFLRNI